MNTLSKLPPLVLALWCNTHALADIYVVSAANNNMLTVSKKDLLAIYMGRNRTLSSGEPIPVYEMPPDDPVRTDFYTALTGLSQAHVNSYWSRLMFTGQTMPPMVMPSELEMVSKIKTTPRAIGYLRKDPKDNSLRIILVLKAPSND